MKQLAKIISVLLLVICLGCASGRDSTGGPGEGLLGGEEKSQPPNSAISFVNPTYKHKANGIFTFTPVPQGLRIVGGLTGLAPGIHALHLHENGDCWADDASTTAVRNHLAGPPHVETLSKLHLGDLGNFAADANGEAKIDYTNTYLSLKGSHSVLGRALIVYEGSDNPTNHPGDRVACGLIHMKSN